VSTFWFIFILACAAVYALMIWALLFRRPRNGGQS
jgi:hypothetical protein